MKFKTLTTFLLTLGLTISFTSNVFAWSGEVYRPYSSYANVHKADTEKWCRDKGFGWYESNIISLHCDSVDTLFHTDKSWHLDRRNFTGDTEDTRILKSQNEMKIAKRKIDEIYSLQSKMNAAKSKLDRLVLETKIKKAKEEALMYLGRSLHPIQDLYAHMDAGINTSNDKLGNSHGMLDVPAVSVKILYPDGNSGIREMKLETTDSSGKLNYSMYDDINYDYIDGQWIFKQDMKREENSRWIKTKEATYRLLDEFLFYSTKKNIKF